LLTHVEMFYSYTTEHVFGRQPLKVYHRKSSGRLLNKGLAKYVECRAYALYGAHDIIPSRIREVSGLVMTFIGETLVEKKATYMRCICEAIAKYAASKHSLIISPTEFAKRL
jgi:hypothetical protein